VSGIYANFQKINKKTQQISKFPSRWRAGIHRKARKDPTQQDRQHQKNHRKGKPPGGRVGAQVYRKLVFNVPLGYPGGSISLEGGVVSLTSFKAGQMKMIVHQARFDFLLK